MKAFKFILVILIPCLFCNGSCRDIPGQKIIVRNNSDMRIIIQFSRYEPISKTPDCMKPINKIEREEFIYYKMVNPHSEKNFERSGGNDDFMHPNDTLYIGVFNLTDIDTMSCEEFKQKYPVIHEWKVTKADMEACNWTLVYPEIK